MRSYKHILDDITGDYCSHACKGCILKLLLSKIHHPDAKMTIQIKCVDKFKFEESERLGHDIGWTEAFDKWVERGYAATYSQIFDEDLPFSQIYKRTLETAKNNK